MSFQTIYGVVFDLLGTLALTTRPVEAVRRQGVLRSVDFLRKQGLDLPYDEFVDAYIDALAFAERKSSVEQEEHLATDTLIFLLQFYNYSHVPGDLIRRAVDLTFAPDLETYALDPQAIPVLTSLRRREVRLGLLTNAQDDRSVQALVEHLGLVPHFDLIVTSAAAGERVRKPNREAWVPFLRAWDLEPHELVMVGDDLVEDVLGALNAGTWTIWLKRTSAGSELERAIRPDAIVTTLETVPAVIDRWEEE